MNNNTSNTKYIVETAMLSAIAATIIWLTNIPFLMFLFIIAAIPITILTTRQGVYAGLIGCVVTGTLLLLTYDPIIAGTDVVMFGVSGVATGYMIRNKWSASKTVTASAIIFSIGLSLILYAYVSLGGVDIFELVNQGFDEMSVMVKERAVSLNMAQEDIKIQTDTIRNLKDQIAKAKPVIVMSYGFIIAACNFFITRPILKRSGTSVAPMVKFRDFKLPSSILPGILLIVVLTWLTDRVGYVDKDIIYINLVVIFSYVFAFQGASTLAYLTAARGGNVEKRAVMVGFVTLLCVLFFGIQVLSLVGLMDATIDIRKLYQNRKV